jgi:hypothetical protein
MKRADIKAFLVMCGSQLLTYFLFSVNARALAQGRMVWTFFTDLIYASISYFVIRRVSQNQSAFGQIGFVMGGAWGSVLAIALTKKLFGQ